jgi:hypothetical protein
MAKTNLLKTFFQGILLIIVLFCMVEFIYWLFSVNRYNEAFTNIKIDNNSAVLLVNSSGDSNTSNTDMEYINTRTDDTKLYAYWTDSKNPAGITIIKDNKIIDSTDASYSDIHDKITVQIYEDSANTSEINDEESFDSFINDNINGNASFYIKYTYDSTDIGNRKVSIPASDYTSTNPLNIWRIDTRDMDNIAALSGSYQVEYSVIANGTFDSIDITFGWDPTYGLTKLATYTDIPVPERKDIPYDQTLTYTLTGDDDSTKTETLDITIIADLDKTDINPMESGNTDASKNWCDNELAFHSAYISGADGSYNLLFDGNTENTFTLDGITQISDINTYDGSLNIVLTEGEQIADGSANIIINQAGGDNIMKLMNEGKNVNVNGIQGYQWNIPFGDTKYGDNTVNDNSCVLDLNIIGKT